MKIGKRDINQDLYIIAEVGSNHDGSLKKAKKMITAAAASGADAAKFQLFTLAGLIQPDYFEKTLGISDQSWREGFRKLEFPLEWLPKLKRHADKVAIDLLFTPFDLPRLQAALSIGSPAVKIASGDLTNTQLLRAAGKSGVPVILSTGASTDEEIKQALKLTSKKNSVLLDCVMAYPAQVNEYGLQRIKQLQKLGSAAVGLSDHTKSEALAALFVYQGGSVLEKHFTLNCNDKGADHAMSTEPAEFARFVSAARDALQLRKQTSITRPDTKERIYARRALYAAQTIRKGEQIRSEDVVLLRPAVKEGVSASMYDSVVNKVAKKSYNPGQVISKNELK